MNWLTKSQGKVTIMVEETEKQDERKRMLNCKRRCGARNLFDWLRARI